MTALAIRELPDLLGTSPADLIDQAAEQPTAILDVARRRAERIRAGLVSYTQMRQDIADAYACRDWVALGHDTWFEYVEREFGEGVRTLSRDRGQRREAVRELRTQGMTQPAIGAALGVSQSTVRDDLKELSDSTKFPERVTGLDGKERPARRATADRPAGPAVPAAVDLARVDEPTDHERERRQRHTRNFAGSLAALWSLLDPDPVAFATDTWDPDANPHRATPGAADAFTSAGLRTLASRLTALADHVDTIGGRL